MYSVDLNSDIGESFGAYKLGDDEAIIRHITAANAARGWDGVSHADGMGAIRWLWTGW